MEKIPRNHCTGVVQVRNLEPDRRYVCTLSQAFCFHSVRMLGARQDQWLLDGLVHFVLFRQINTCDSGAQVCGNKDSLYRRGTEEESKDMRKRHAGEGGVESEDRSSVCTLSQPFHFHCVVRSPTRSSAP